MDIEVIYWINFADFYVSYNDSFPIIGLNMS